MCTIAIANTEVIFEMCAVTDHIKNCPFYLNYVGFKYKFYIILQLKSKPYRKPKGTAPMDQDGICTPRPWNLLQGLLTLTLHFHHEILDFMLSSPPFFFTPVRNPGIP